jgi:hypothetical protein
MMESLYDFLAQNPYPYSLFLTKSVIINVFTETNVKFKIKNEWLYSRFINLVYRA